MTVGAYALSLQSGQVVHSWLHPAQLRSLAPGCRTEQQLASACVPCTCRRALAADWLAAPCAPSPAWLMLQGTEAASFSLHVLCLQTCPCS